MLDAYWSKLKMYIIPTLYNVKIDDEMEKTKLINRSKKQTVKVSNEAYAILSCTTHKQENVVILR